MLSRTLAAQAVSPDTLYLSQIDDQVYLTNRATLTITSIDTPWQRVKQLPALQRLPKAYATSPREACWLRLFLHNDTPSPLILYAYVGEVQTARFYLDGPERLDSLRAGSMVPTDEWATAESDQYVSLSLTAGEVAELGIRLANAEGVLPQLTRINYPHPSLSVRLETESFHHQRVARDYRNNSTELLYRTWIQGALLFFLFFVGLIYGQYRQPIYGYYFLYVLAGCIFSLLKTRAYTPLGHWISYFPMVRTHLLETVLWLGLAAYLFFLTELLDLRTRHPPAHRWLRRIAWGFAGFGVLYAILLLLTNDGGLQRAVFWGTRYGLIPLYVALLVWVSRRVRSPLTGYVVLGNVLMAAVGILAWLRAGGIILKGVTLPGGVDNLMMVSFAVLLEIIVFALALAYRIRLIDRERQASHRAYIDEVEQRTAYEKRLSEVEMLALRSQMNPHFLFNSLNTIEYFVLKGDEEKASRYLSSFSRLLRLILNHSNEDIVRLSDELLGLRLYLELEATRFGDEFVYTLDVDARVDQEEVWLPPLLLQPFVENAIWHGLRQSQLADKRLYIRIIAENEHTLRFEIEDNGIGRQQAGHLKSRTSIARKSYGMAITQQRIELFNRNYPTQLDVQLIDIDNNGQTGTLARINYRLITARNEHESHSD
ncbi:Sensor protein lytS [Fibrisoma limi BUZ 3]|uniref:Sensor protein lytS n=2 Tax=Fibrisoma limi TaxID=663275 RepID=I2GIE8_9BACT|nr:Sensor protein lytS [Fibrisoma limi BUZ 3]